MGSNNIKRQRCPRCNRLQLPCNIDRHLMRCMGKPTRQPRPRRLGETYRPTVTALKVKNGVPTVIEMSGRAYVLRPGDQYRGGGQP